MLTTNEYISNHAPWWSQLKEFKENIRVQHIMRQFTYIIFIIYVYVREKVCHPLESHNSDASIYFIKKEYPPICNYFSPRFTFKHIITSFVFTVLQECLVHFGAVQTWYNKFYSSSLCTICSAVWHYVTRGHKKVLLTENGAVLLRC